MDVSALLEEVNYVAVLVAALASFAVGAVWYAQSVFGKRWMELTGTTPQKAKENMKSTMLGGFILTLITAFVLALVLPNLDGWVDGLFDGALVGLGLGATAVAMHDMYEAKPKELTLINAGYVILGTAVMGFVLALFS